MHDALSTAWVADGVGAAAAEREDDHRSIVGMPNRGREAELLTEVVEARQGPTCWHVR